VATARGILDEGESTAAIMRAFNFSSQFPADKLADQASRYPLERLRQAFRRIVAADFEHKSGLCDEDVSLELLVQDLAAAGAPRRTVG
jgi:DNA polymerase III delta subunit